MLKGKAKKKLNGGVFFWSTEETNWLHETFGGLLFSGAPYLGFRNSFFFWMWLFVSKSPWSFLSYSLWILSCYTSKQINLGQLGRFFGCFFPPRCEGMTAVVWTPRAVSVVTQTESIYMINSTEVSVSVNGATVSH